MLVPASLSLVPAQQPHTGLRCYVGQALEKEEEEGGERFKQIIIALLA